MTQPLVVTQSTIKDKQRCKRRWYLKYYRRKTRPKYGSALTVGNMVHDALASWYAGELENPLDHVNESAARAREEFPSDARSIDKDAELAGIMLEGYLEWLEETGSDYELQAIEPEREVEVELVGARDRWASVRLRAKIDGKVRRRDGWTAFLEHKTVGNFVDLPAIARMDPQLLTYELIEFMEQTQELEKHLEETDKLPTERQRPLVGGYIFNLLRKVKRTARAKPPFFERHEGSHNVHQLRNHWLHVVSESRDIQSMTDRLNAGESHHTVAPPSVRTTCRWDCDFFDICPLFDDGSDAESVLEREYEDHNPLERYAELEKTQGSDG